MPFSFKSLSISDVILVEPDYFSDDRGYFLEIFHESIFQNHQINTKFIQDNISYSKKNILRGLHFQLKPKAQAKLISVIRGEIFDVAVDIRKNSSTYGQWVGQILSSSNHKSLYIPEGFAHGFCVLSDDAYVMYKTNEHYFPEFEKGIMWNDPSLGITWPINKPILSEKDLKLSFLSDVENNF